MLEFYQKSILLFIALLVLSISLAALSYHYSYSRELLLPQNSDKLPWTLHAIDDVKKGGASSLRVNHSNYHLDYDYVIRKSVEYPFVSLVFAFDELDNAKSYVDLSQYSALSFLVKCTPDNLLSMVVHSFDPKATSVSNFSSYRMAQSLFTCNQKWEEIVIDLNNLIVPQWWLSDHKFKISDQEYWLDKVVALSITASGSGPVEERASVKVSEFSLRGRDFRLAWISGLFLAIAWLTFFIYLLRRYTLALVEDIKEKLHSDRPLIALTQLSNEYQEEGETSKILHFMATKYANPDLNLELAVSSLGISHTKFNAILKSVYGLTFVAYLNKIRLTEAARLLKENKEVSVSKIVHTVGYKNVSYFNQLFKKEYGCTPVKFRKLYIDNDK